MKSPAATSLLVLNALLVASLGCSAGALSAPRNADPLASGFLSPPPPARPATYWLWLNGYVNRAHLETEIRQFSELGIGGLCLFDMGARGRADALPSAGPAFLSDESVELIAAAIRLAGKYHLDVQLAACSSWDLGGTWVTPAQASMGLYRTELVLEGPQDFRGPLPFPALPAKAPKTPDGRPAFCQEIALLAVPGAKEKSTPLVIKNPAAVINLTAQLQADGQLEWQVPPGKWTLLRFVCANTGERLKVPSPNSDGLATDHFSAEATRAFLQHVIDRLRPKVGDFRQSALKQLYLPSYEVRGATWTPDFLAQFRRYRNYDMTPYLPALADCQVGDEETTQRFLYDYQKTLGDLLVDAYYRTASETAKRAGLGIEAEAGGPGPPVHQVPVDALKALGSIDEIRGEFWPWREDRSALWVVKETACAAHVYGKRRVHMEAFTTFRHWQDGPWELKPSADRAFCEGMNHVVWHTSSHQPPEAGQPGWVYGAGTHLLPNLVWWPMAKPFVEYLARCSHLLQQGRFVGDVCFYYGDQAFNFVPPKHVIPELGFGYDYDVANPEVILTRMRMQDGRVTLPDGMQYELLVLPDRDDMDWPVLQKIAELVRAGATLVGRKPLRSNGLTDYPNRDQQVRALADAMWGRCDGKTVFESTYGAGKVIWGRPLKDILRERGLGPDFGFTSAQTDTDLDYIHRRTDEADIYFIRNKKPRWEEVTAHFRVRGKQPELWWPDTSGIERAPVWQGTGEGTQVALRLPPGGSVFVVFRDPSAQPHPVSVRTDAAPTGPPTDYPAVEVATAPGNAVQLTAYRDGMVRLETSTGRPTEVRIAQVPPARAVSGPWQVRFTAGWGARESATFERLISWTEHADEGIRYFSGRARYEQEIEIPAEWLRPDIKLWLDLGQLWAVGRVSLNGQPLGILWKPPYRVVLTDAAKPGANKLVVEVANTWSNRLVGDAHAKDGKRYCRTNIERSGTPGKSWKDVPLNPSGLLGPVRLVPARVVKIQL